MPKVLKGTHQNGNNYFLIECPACRCGHSFSKDWTFNGDFEKPTFSPSLLIKSARPKGFSNENPAPFRWSGEYEDTICHSYVIDGNIQYLDDCTHEFAGKTIELEEI